MSGDQLVGAMSGDHVSVIQAAVAVALAALQLATLVIVGSVRRTVRQVRAVLLRAPDNDATPTTTIQRKDTPP